MLFGSGGGAGGGGRTVASAGMMLVRHFSRKRAEDVRRINPKVPREEAKAISEGLFQIVKDHGPLSVSNTWNHAKEAALNGLNSKTHMKILLKWMRGRKLLRLYCTHIGSSKKFLYTTLPEEPKPVQQDISATAAPKNPKNLVQKKKQIKKRKK